jgi:hypothetical protein
LSGTANKGFYDTVLRFANGRVNCSLLFLENHFHAVALYFAYYNFAGCIRRLRVTPAMEAGIADHIWPLEGLVSLLENVRPMKESAA